MPEADTSREGPALGGERKSVSVLFADLSGYTALAERTDPEHVRSLLSQLLGEAAQVVAEYEGHIERFLGDAIMAVFGVPIVHEDDAERAVLAAQEIERRAERIVVPNRSGGGTPLRMHSAIATGFVVHGELGPREAGETVLGDTVNVAARLTSQAGAGEIVVSEATFEMTCGQFEFAPLGPVQIRGRVEPVHAYLLVGRASEPVSVRRSTGLRSEFVGRTYELDRLYASAKRLLRGSRVFLAVVGGPGTGKSRLVDEFRRGSADLPLSWRVAQCHAHSQKTPYSALKDLLGRTWAIDPQDHPERIKETIDTRLAQRRARSDVRTARLARLWGIEDPVLAGMDPEAWRTGLYGDVLGLLESIAGEGASVMLLEDLHWADRQSLDLLNHVLESARTPILALCTSRSISALESLGPATRRGLESDVLKLDDLSADEAATMCCSMLGCSRLPGELEDFVRRELGGNPFFVEEAVNTLVTTGILVPSDGDWRLVRPLTAFEVPLTVTGLIEARVDRLGPVAKSVAQEASLIGRVFSADVLRHATLHPDALDEALAELVRRDLIRCVSTGSEDEPEDWEFRHALVQETISKGLLSEELAAIHDRIGTALEVVYADRAVDFAEVIAEHFMSGRTPERAVQHLIRAAESCMDRDAVKEADALYREAYGICAARQRAGSADISELLDTVCRWARVGYYMGDFEDLEALLRQHYEEARATADADLRAGYEFWFGYTLWHRQKLREAEEHLQNALRLAGPPVSDVMIEALAHAELCYTYADLGLLRDATEHVERACELAVIIPEDYFVWQEAFGASAYLAWCLGRADRANAAASRLLDHAAEYGNVRCLAFGHWSMAFAHEVGGDLAKACEEDELALSVTNDPWLLQFPKFFMAICATRAGDFVQARELLEDLVAYAEDRGATTLEVPAKGLLGAALAGLGEADRGIAMLEESERVLRRDERTWAHVNALYILGALHAIVARGETERGLRTMLRNPRFALKHALRAERIARGYLSDVIERADTIGAYGLSGECWLELAELNEAKHRTDAALRCYESALERFEACGAAGYCARVSEARARLVSAA